MSRKRRVGKRGQKGRVADCKLVRKCAVSVTNLSVQGHRCNGHRKFPDKIRNPWRRVRGAQSDLSESPSSQTQQGGPKLTWLPTSTDVRAAFDHPRGAFWRIS